MLNLPSIGRNMSYPVPFITCHHCGTDQQVEDTLERYIAGVEFQCQKCGEVIMSADAQAPSQGTDVHVHIESSMG